MTFVRNFCISRNFGIYKILFAGMMGSVAMLTVPASAQEDNTVTYDQAYFSQYNAVTLEDMINNIPGGTSMLSDIRRDAKYEQTSRGFGSNGAQILINGKRMSGKANDIAANLTRISAAQVERIDLIRGNAEGLDIRSEGILFNVILKEGQSSQSSTLVEARFDYTKGGEVKPNGQIAFNGKSDALSYGISYKYDVWQRIKNVEEDNLDPDGVLYQLRPYLSDKLRKSHIFTGNLGYEFPEGSRIRLNSLYEKVLYDELTPEQQFTVNPTTLFATETTVMDFSSDKWEVGGDFETNLDLLGNLKALFIINRSDHLDHLTQDHVENDVTSINYDNLADYRQDEKIFRTALTTPLAAAHSLEWGGEGAFNKLDKAQSFYNAADEQAIVKEDRYEIFATHSWAIADDLNLQSSLTEEFSRIFQDRLGVTNTRKYQYLKPRFELRYDLTGNDQFRLKSERTVSQLNLNYFIASRNIADDSIDFGNPNLEPEKIWEHSAAYERRFDDDAGSLETKVTLQDISDHIDRIQIGDRDDATSGVGNIGNAWRFKFDFRGNFRLDPIGLPNATLTATYRYMKHRTTDPFTGLKRQTSSWNPHYWNLDYQHDFPEYNFRYGFNLHKRSASWRQDIFLIERRGFSHHFTVFAEYTYNDIKARLHLGHLLKDKRTLDKTLYAGHIADGVIDRYENKTERFNPDFYLSIRTTF